MPCTDTIDFLLIGVMAFKLPSLTRHISAPESIKILSILSLAKEILSLIVGRTIDFTLRSNPDTRCPIPRSVPSRFLSQLRLHFY